MDVKAILLINAVAIPVTDIIDRGTFTLFTIEDCGSGTRAFKFTTISTFFFMMEMAMVMVVEEAVTTGTRT